MEAAEDAVEAAEDAVEAEDAVDAASSPIQRCGGIGQARLVDVSSKQTFLELGAEGKSLGRLLIRLSPVSFRCFVRVRWGHPEDAVGRSGLVKGI